MDRFHQVPWLNRTKGHCHGNYLSMKLQCRNCPCTGEKGPLFLKLSMGEAGPFDEKSEQMQPILMVQWLRRPNKFLFPDWFSVYMGVDHFSRVNASKMIFQYFSVNLLSNPQDPLRKAWNQLWIPWRWCTIRSSWVTLLTVTGPFHAPNSLPVLPLGIMC